MPTPTPTPTQPIYKGHANLRSLMGAEAAISAHTTSLGIEGDSSVQIWHLVASLAEFAVTQGTSLQEVLTDVNAHILRGELGLPAAQRQLRQVESVKSSAGLPAHLKERFTHTQVEDTVTLSKPFVAGMRAALMDAQYLTVVDELDQAVARAATPSA